MNTQAKPEQHQGPPRSRPGEPTWEVTEFFPRQGQWSEAEYLALETNRLVEFHNGCLEVLPMPSALHQAIAGLLYRLLFEYVRDVRKRGTVLPAPMPIKVSGTTYREPDVMLLGDTLSPESLNVPAIEAEVVQLVIEVVSPSNREHDTVTKRAEYAAAGIPEYWIVEPELPRITVLELDGTAYKEHGSFGAGESATSRTLDGFAVAVDLLRDPAT